MKTIKKIRPSPKYIWDYDVKKLDLTNPKVLKWYLERKIKFGDWSALRREWLKKHLSEIKIDPYVKEILKYFLRRYAKEKHSH